MNQTAIEEIESKVARFPQRPGVYLMKDQKGEVIYVGKAKQLKNRVRSYFRGGDDRRSIPYILKRIHDIEVIITESEDHAFVLERDLITKYKPRYNIRLKDDKAYLHVRIDRQKEWPHIELVRRPQNDGAEYYGPYTFSYELRTVLDLIKKVIPLRTCKDAIFYNRQRPCLEYQIKRCSGPCCLEVDREQYSAWVDQAVEILLGGTEGIQKELEDLMERASEQLRFEDAALYRDRLETIEKFTSRKSLVGAAQDNHDAFALYREETLAVLTVLRMQFGRVASNDNFCLSQVEVPDEEIIASSLAQYYRSGRDVPEEILLPVEIEGLKPLKEELQELRGEKVEILTPKRGVKFRLLGLANINAKEHFITEFDQEERYQRVAETIARMAELSQLPRRIECIDISNLQGSDIVGAVVSFFDGKPDKSRYRKYKLSTEGKPDDFASIKEVVSRKLKRQGAHNDALPDLLVIDGGKAQLDKALEAIDDAGASLDVIALAKIRDQSGKKRTTSSLKGASDIQFERVFLPGRSDPIRLDEKSESTKFLQRLRDEAHRFVIEFHRDRRKKRVQGSKLDDIPGIGPKRKQKLIDAFGSLKALKEASAEEIAEKGNLAMPLALQVKNRLT